jgi:hypothetical protein
MELLTCPACGCSVQTADALLGRRVRCSACRHTFVATEEHIAAPPRRETPDLPPQRSRTLGPRPVPDPDGDEDHAGEDRGPFCPGCGRRIAWRDLTCPHCGEELEPEDNARRAACIRRDYEPHRGALILSLGNVSMFLGALSLCTFGLGALLSVPLGIFTWGMANRDLERMREGLLDPRGKKQTETGRVGAVTGIILGGIFAAFYALLYLAG